jgi:GNAT superfamily N-acetyltransferase
MDLTIRRAMAEDCPLLGAMNRRLADAEGSRNPLPAAALAERMAKWLNEGWQAALFEEESAPIGYCVFQLGADYYDPSIPEVYLRQFFIEPARRGLGLGRQAFALLRSTEFPAGAHLHLDVLATNPRGQRFWEAMGFQPYSIALRLDPK